MPIPKFTAELSLRQPNRYAGAAALPKSALSGVIPQLPVTTPFCGPCLCHTAEGCDVSPNPGYQGCVAVDTHGSWNPFSWEFSIDYVPCLGATHGTFSQ